MSGKPEINTEVSWIAHKGSVCTLLHVPDRNLIISGSYDDTISIWKFGEEGEKPTLEINISDFENEDPNCVIRCNKDSFLCVTDLGTIHSYSLDPPYSPIRMIDLRKDINKNAGREKDNEFDFLRLVSVVKLFRSHPKDRKNSDTLAIVAKLDSLGGIIIIKISTGEILHIHTNMMMTVSTYSEIKQSLSKPDHLLFNSGMGHTGENNDSKMVLINMKTGKVVKRYEGNTYNIYAFDSFMLNKTDREILIAGGNDERVYFFEVETAILMKVFSAEYSVCSFLKLGRTHFLIGEGSQNLQVINVEKLDLFNSSDRYYLVDEKELKAHSLSVIEERQKSQNQQERKKKNINL